MKKIAFSLMLACSGLLCTAPAFADDSDTVTLRVAWWGANSRHQNTLKTIRAFEQAHPHIKVKAEYTGWDGFVSRLSTQIAGKNEPDVMQLDWSWIQVFSRSGNGFYDLNQLSKEVGLDNYAGKLGTVTVNGKVQGLPVSLVAPILYYNTETWKKAGLAYPKTWDELFAAGQVFKEKLGDNYYPAIVTTSMELINSWMVQKYNQPMLNEKGEFTYSEAQWLEFVQVYQKLVAEHVLPSQKYIQSFGKAQPFEMKPWINGEFGGSNLMSSAVAKYEDTLAPPAKLEVGPYPLLPGAKDAGLFIKPSMIFAISRNTQHPKEAAMLLDFMVNQPEGVQLMGLERGFPVSKAAADFVMKTDMAQPNDPVITGLKLVESMPSDNVYVSPYFKNPEIEQYWLDLTQRIDYGKISAEDAAKEFERTAKRALRKHAPTK
ncbi:ABC transporter substrate-binding protein [Kluyvera sichuanensis]